MPSTNRLPYMLLLGEAANLSAKAAHRQARRWRQSRKDKVLAQSSFKYAQKFRNLSGRRSKFRNLSADAQNFEICRQTLKIYEIYQADAQNFEICRQTLKIYEICRQTLKIYEICQADAQNLRNLSGRRSKFVGRKVWKKELIKQKRKKKPPTNRFPYIVANPTHNNQQRSQQHRQARRCIQFEKMSLFCAIEILQVKFIAQRAKCGFKNTHKLGKT